MAKQTFVGVGTYALRRAMGIKGKNANAYNICIAGKLSEKYVRDAKAAGVKGGRLDPEIRKNFVEAVNACKGIKKQFKSAAAKRAEGGGGKAKKA